MRSKAPLPYESFWATPEEATGLGIAMEELSEAQAEVSKSKDSRSAEETNSGWEEVILESPTLE